MDDIAYLSRVRADVVAPSAADLGPARERLLGRALRETNPVHQPRRRRPLVRFALALTLVLVVAGSLAVLNPFAARPATAAGLLRQAADNATADLTPAPGQYLAIHTRERSLGYVEGEGTEAGSIVGAYRTLDVSTTYVPHDRDSVWVRRYYAEPPSTFYGGEVVRRAAARDYAESAHADSPGTERARGGQFGDGELGGGAAGIATADIPELPREPQQLLGRLERSGGAGDGPQVAAIETASALLRSGLVPLDLRRSLYDALALLPDVQIARHTVTLDGRTGTAIGVAADATVWSVVVDTESGDYLGDLQTQTRDVGAVPAGTIVDETSLRTSLVDAPR